MKKIYSLILALAAVLFTSCQDTDPFITASEDDYPKILLPWMEWENGEMPEYKNFTRDIEFVDSAIVTPALYTKVEWLIDGEKVHEGKKIQKTFLAGTYVLKLVATTTKGLSTSRTGKIVVRPCVGDPTLKKDEKSRYLNPGTTKTIEGSNLEGITGAYINGVAVGNFVNNGNSITFDVPQMEEGTYRLVLENSEMQFGCDEVKVTNEPWVDPGIETIVLWEGDQAVPEWTTVDMCSTKMQELVNAGKVKAGTPLTIEFDVTGTDYCSVVLINNSWLGILTGGDDKSDVGRGDINPDPSQKKIAVEIPEIGIELIKNGGFYLTGHGYQIKKVSVDVESANAVKVLWEGSHEVTWGTPLEDMKAESLTWANDGTLAAGKTLKIYVKGTEGAQGTATTAWWNNIFTGLDGEANRGDVQIQAGAQVLEFELTDVSARKIAAEDGLIIVGNGYTVTKVTVE